MGNSGIVTSLQTHQISGWHKGKSLFNTHSSVQPLRKEKHNFGIPKGRREQKFSFGSQMMWFKRRG